MALGVFLNCHECQKIDFPVLKKAVAGSRVGLGGFKPTHFQKGIHEIYANSKTFFGVGWGVESGWERKSMSCTCQIVQQTATSTSIINLFPIQRRGSLKTYWVLSCTAPHLFLHFFTLIGFFSLNTIPHR